LRFLPLLTSPLALGTMSAVYLSGEPRDGIEYPS
jgi:hypothetical protein